MKLTESELFLDEREAGGIEARETCAGNSAKTVYIVTDGEYSDYHICEVFTDKRQAQLYAAANNCYGVEEYEADRIKADAAKKPLRQWVAIIDRGFVHHVFGNGFTFANKEVWQERSSWKNGRFYTSLEPDIEEEQAVKIIADRYSKWNAERMGL